MLKIRLTALFAALTLFTAASVFAQMKPIKFEKETLPNGLEVIYHVDKSAPIVATVIHYRVGSKDEMTTNTGYAHFFEHLMFEATGGYKRAELDKIVEEAGGTLNAHTSFDETVYYLKMPSNHIRTALWLESQRMRGLKVETVGVETQRGVVGEEQKMRRDNSPYGNLIDKLYGNLFKGAHYEWSVLGSAEHIKSAKISDFQAFYDKFYQPNNATLSIAGDFEIADAKKWVREYFGIFPKGPEPQRFEVNPAPLTSTVRETVIDSKAQLPGLFIGFQSPKLTDPDYYAFSVLTTILSGGESSRLYKRLVSDEQAAVEASVQEIPMEKAGAAFFVGIPTPGKDVAALEKLFDEEVKKVAKDGITDKELEKVKNMNEASFIVSKKDALEKAETLANYNSYFRDPNLINSELEKYNAVTKEDVRRVAQKYLDTDKRVVLTYIPESSKTN
ncbi:MAG: M16 family metallopeptidase [Chloroflexota bacterium]